MRLTRLAIATAPALFVLLWSTGFIGARYGLPYVEPLTFLAVRMVFAVVIMAAIAIIGNVRWPDRSEVGHSLVAGSLVHGLCLGGVFTAISQGVPAGISALILGPQPIVTSGRTFAGVGRGLACPARPQHRAGRLCPWLGCKLLVADRHYARHAVPETLLRRYRLAYRQCRPIRWRGLLFTLGAFAFETREIHWTGELIFAMAWLVLVLSIAAVGLMYWLIRRSPATGFASLFYLVPAVTAFFAFILFDERLDSISILGMVICAGGVALVNRGTSSSSNMAAQS